MKITILGQEYEIIHQTEKENQKLENADGICETYSKKIILNNFEISSNTLDNVEDYKNKVLRHEVIHAFIHESGLDLMSEWARNEEMVDFFAIQIPKMIEVFRELKIIKEKEVDKYNTKEQEEN